MPARRRYIRGKKLAEPTIAKIRQLEKEPRERPLTQEEIANKVKVNPATVYKYSGMPKQHWRRAKRLALQGQRIPTEVAERIKALGTLEVRDKLGQIRKLAIAEIIRKMDEEGLKISETGVRAVLINSGLRTAAGIRRLGKTIQRRTNREKPLPTKGDIKLVKRILMDPDRKIPVGNIPAYIKEQGSGTITQNDVETIYERLKQQGKAKKIENRAAKINLFSPKEKAGKIKENEGLIHRIMHGFNCDNREMLASITARLFEKLDEYDPAKGMKVSSFIGMHTRYFIINTFRDKKKERKNLEEYGKSAPKASLPSDMERSIARGSKFSVFFTQEMPADLAPSERRAVEAYKKLARRTIMKEGRFPNLQELGKELDPKMPLTKQAVSSALNKAKNKYPKEE